MDQGEKVVEAAAVVDTTGILDSDFFLKLNSFLPILLFFAILMYYWREGLMGGIVCLGGLIVYIFFFKTFFDTSLNKYFTHVPNDGCEKWVGKRSFLDFFEDDSGDGGGGKKHMLPANLFILVFTIVYFSVLTFVPTFSPHYNYENFVKTNLIYIISGIFLIFFNIAYSMKIHEKCGSWTVIFITTFFAFWSGLLWALIVIYNNLLDPLPARVVMNKDIVSLEMDNNENNVYAVQNLKPEAVNNLMQIIKNAKKNKQT